MSFACLKGESLPSSFSRFGFGSSATLSLFTKRIDDFFVNLFGLFLIGDVPGDGYGDVPGEGIGDAAGDIYGDKASN